MPPVPRPSKLRQEEAEEDKKGDWQENRNPRRDAVKHPGTKRKGSGGIGTGMTAAPKGQN